MAPRVRVGPLGESALSPRELRVLQLRLGVGGALTLDQIGKRFGITRERVRQLEATAVRKLASLANSPNRWLDALEADLIRSGFTTDRIRDESTVRSAIAAAQRRTRGSNGGCAVEETLVFLRAVGPFSSSRWAVSTFLACALPPVIKNHSAAYQAVRADGVEHNNARRQWTYADLAERVLADAGKPMHWGLMAERAEGLALRRRFGVGTFFNALADRKRFVRVDTGTYGLVAWGLSSAETYVDLVAEHLKEVGHPLTEGEIFQAVSQTRPVKQNSLGMMLDLNVRFYESLETTYGLRAWLQPRRRQTLRTPPGYVETLASLQREGRAIENGYDVAAIVARDRQKS
jgi:DNA-binding CsgD family transcriptional regulator